MKSHLDILRSIYNQFGGVSTRVADKIIELQGVKEPELFELQKYRLTT